MSAAGTPGNNDPNQPRAEEDQWAPPPAEGNDAWGHPPYTTPGQPPETPADGQDPGAAPPSAWGTGQHAGGLWGSALPPLDAFNSPAAAPPDAFGAVPPPEYAPAAPHEPFPGPVPPPPYINQTAPPEAAPPLTYSTPPPPAYGSPTAPPPPTYGNAAPPPAPTYGDPAVPSQHHGAQPPQHAFVPRNEPWVVQGKQRRGFPKALVLTAAGALIVVGGGGFGLFTLVSGDAEPDPAKVPTSQVADALFATDTSAPDGFDQEIADVASAGNTVVAAGFEVDDTTSHPKFIVSTDRGRTWRTAPITAEDENTTVSGRPDAVIGTPGGWLALGGAATERHAWTSTDGSSWTQVKERLTAFQADDHVEALTRAGQTFVAVGRRGADEDGSPVVWLSPDGRSWQRMDGKKLKLPAATGKPGRLGYVAAAGDTLLLTGELIKSKGSQAAVWRSSDGGRSWTAPQAPSSEGAFGPVHLAAGTNGFFALRESKDGENRIGAVFQSANGDDWRPVGSVRSSNGTPLNPQRITAGDQGFAVLAAGPDGRKAIYQSSDGAAWQHAADLGDASGPGPAGFAVTGGTTVIGGTRRGTDQNFYLAVANGSGNLSDVDLTKVAGAVTTKRSVTDIATADGRTVAVGSANGKAAAWTSADGVTWSRADTGSLTGSPNGPAQQSFTNVVHGTQGWLAIGSRGGRPAAATSPDGRSWQPLADNTFASADDRGMSLSAAAHGPKGYVVAGTVKDDDTKSSATAWYSADLRTWRRAEIPAAKDSTSHTMLDVAAGSTGYVAVGESTDPAKPAEQRSRPAIWTSTDGLQWTEKQADLPDRATTGSLSHISIKGNSVVAAGDALFSGTRAFSMVSDDLGLTWRAAQLPVPTRGTPTYVTAQAATGGAFVIVGNLGGTRTGDVIQWNSADGRSWQTVSPKGAGLSGDGFQRITGLAAHGNGLFGVGITTEAGTRHTTLWRAPAPN